MRLSSSYTPQAVVGGKRELVGSNRSGLNAALEAASNVKPAGDVTLSVRREGNALVATIHATVPAGDDLFLAVTEDDVTTKVPHGENAGRTITNDAIVRKLIRVPAGQMTVTVPIEPAWRNISADAFIQDRTTLAVGAVAAAQAR